MKRTLSLQALVLALVAGTLLFAQILGLHHHLHSDTVGHESHASELHFGDAGLHDEDHAASDSDRRPDHHSGNDIEVRAIGAALVKAFLSMLPLGLMLSVVLLLLPPTVVALRERQTFAPARRRYPFALLPPSHGPPRLSQTLPD